MSETAPPELQGEYFRLDLAQTLVSADDETRIARFIVVPDPRRYDCIEQEDGPVWYDKYMHTGFGIDVLRQMMEQAPGLPLYAGRRNFDDGPTYSTQRLASLDSEHSTGTYVPPAEKPEKVRKPAPSDEVLNVTFVSVDVCGSTALRAKDADAYDRALKVMIRELVVTLGQFHGSVLKLTGDGFIGFFDGPSINTQCDQAADACVTLLRVLHEAVNPAAERAGLPKLSVRIGADHGEAVFSVLQIEDVGLTEENVSSDALNRAVKLQEAAPTDAVLIGRALYERVHVQWLERCSEHAPLEGITNQPYRAYWLG